MREAVTELLVALGGEITAVFGEESRSFHAVLEPAASLARQSARRQLRALGLAPRSQFVYVGPYDLSRADYVLRRGQKLVCRICQLASLGGEELFYWGLCVPVGEDRAWTES